MGRRTVGSIRQPNQARVVADPLELTRFRGHLTLWGGGIHLKFRDSE